MVDRTDRSEILIVDDSPESIDVLVASLPDSYRCRFALDGEKAFAMLEDRDGPLPDLILLDVVMPGMDGFEVCVRLKQDPAFREIPVIFLSVRADVEFKLRAFASGAVDYVSKPFSTAEVRARVEAHLRIRRLQLELERHNRHLELLVRERTARVLEAQMETLFALVRLVSSRDDSSTDRVERIQESCRILAQGLRRNPKYASVVDDEYIELIRNACVLHDIGKVAVPDRILLKPGPLTPEEREEMRLHTLVGAKTLQDVMERHPGNGFIAMGAEIALSHHERWDGSGYPRGLAGDSIPLSAQIMAVIDDYIALVSRRPYKLAFDRNDALGVIMSGSGAHYNPAIVEAFIVCEPRIWALHKDAK